MRKYLIGAFVALAVLLARDSEAQGCFGPGCGGGSSSTTLTAGTTATSGCVAGGVLYSISGFVKCDGNFTFDNNILTVGNVTTAGRSTIKLQDTISGASATSNFLNITGAFPSTLSLATSGVLFSIVGDDSSVVQYGQQINFSGATTGASSYGLYVTNSQGSSGGGSTAIAGINTGSGGGGGVAYGVIGQGGSGGSFGVGGLFHGGGGGAGYVTAYGLQAYAGNATNRYGGAFGLTAVPTASGSAGLLVSNNAIAADIVRFVDNTSATPTTEATATWNIRDGAIPQVGTGVLTSGTMTAEAQAYARGSMIHSATWSNAQVVALGAATAGDIIAFTLPAKHVVENAYVIITGQGAGTTTLTVSCGRTGAGYIDYIVASDAQAAANTVYGDASGERGTNLTGYDLPSYTGTTAVTCNFVSTGANLDQVTGSTGRVVVITSLIP